MDFDIGGTIKICSFMNLIDIFIAKKKNHACIAFFFIWGHMPPVPLQFLPMYLSL